MFNFSEETKKKIIDALAQNDGLFSNLDCIEVVDFFDSLLDLKSIPSKSQEPWHKPTTIYDDFFQHYVNNDDYQNIDIFNIDPRIINDDNIFVAIITKIVSPEARKTISDILYYCNLIEEFTKNENFVFQIFEYEPSTNLPIYKLVQDDSNNDYLRNIPKNNIIFYVGQSSAVADNPDAIYPCFNLRVINFNDHGNFSNYNLYYYPEKGTSLKIGRLKIIKKDNDDTSSIIPKSFIELADYCSLGDSIGYYRQLKEIFGDYFYSKLRALKDCAFFPDTLLKFENDEYFIKSIIREDNHERLIRRAKHLINNKDLKSLYKFNYKFKPNYAEDYKPIQFDFDEYGLLSNRIITLIGKNGCGKTQLLSKLPIDLSKKLDHLFEPQIPQFGKIISVSYSMFDHHQFPKSDFDFNYISCSLRDANGKLLNIDDLTTKLINSCLEIMNSKRTEKWFNTISTFLDDSIVDQLRPENIKFPIKIAVENIGSILEILSSGQSILLTIITEIIQNIRYDSLIIYDEPETHLHPNAISQLTNTLYKLTDEFESFCLIATHSPLIVQEMLAKNVYILEKEENLLFIRKPNTETFGENLTVITNEIFGNRDVPDYFKIQLRKLVAKGHSAEKILQTIQTVNTEVSLNVNLFLKSLFNEKS